MRGNPAGGVAELLAAAQELALVGSWEMDLRSGRTLWSEAIRHLLGLPPGAAPDGHDDFLRHVHPDDRERVGDLLGTVVERPGELPPEGVAGEYRIVRPDGAVRDVRARGTLERDAGGTPVRWICTVQDVTDQRLGERELEAHYAVSQALREWESFEAGVVELLRLLTTALVYDVGSLWVWDGDRGGIVCRAFWHRPEIPAAGFEELKRSLVFRPGQGKPGRAWQTREPVVTPDVITDPGFQPRDAAVAHGIVSALAFPAVAEDGPVAVVSLYSRERRTTSSSLRRTLTTIGHELGHFLATRRAELGPRPLTEREVEILKLAAEGNSGPQIAERIYVSPSTVKTHFENIYEKLGVSDRAAAVAYGIRTGLIR